MEINSKEVQAGVLVDSAGGATASEFYSTDDESTGQRCSAVKENQVRVEVNLEKIISKRKRCAIP